MLAGRFCIREGFELLGVSAWRNTMRRGGSNGVKGRALRCCISDLSPIVDKFAAPCCPPVQPFWAFPRRRASVVQYPYAIERAAVRGSLLFQEEETYVKALIPAAGMGTRFLPATKAQPKEMLLVVDRPVIQYVVEEGLASGADEVVIVNSREKKSIEKHFSPDPALVATLRERGKDAYADEVERVDNLNVSYMYQDEPLGLGHAIHCAAEKTAGEPFFVLLGDVIVPDNNICPRMLEVSRAHGGASVIAVVAVPDSEVSRFGIVGG